MAKLTLRTSPVFFFVKPATTLPPLEQTDVVTFITVLLLNVSLPLRKCNYNPLLTSDFDTQIEICKKPLTISIQSLKMQNFNPTYVSLAPQKKIFIFSST